MKTKLIQTKDYLLLIDEEAEIKEGDYYLDGDNNLFTPQHNFFVIKSFNKAIGYYPLNSEAKELDLPLLPNPFKGEDIERLALKWFVGCNKKDIIFDLGWKKIFEAGYKAAQSDKQFSLEDMMKAIEMAKNSMGVDNCGESCYSNKTNEEIIQSLSQQLPKEFIPEYEANIDNSPYTSIKMNKALKALKESSKIGCKLKTITNSDGKEELVGTYKY